MKKLWIYICLLFVSTQVYGQQKNERIVVLGASHARNCELYLEKVTLINTSVADFTSGQLLWTIGHGVINHSPEICIIQTGSLDILLGIPQEKVLENLRRFHEILSASGIHMVLIEDFPYWQDSVLTKNAEDLSLAISGLSQELGIQYISLDDSEINKSEINPSGLPVLTQTGCRHFQSLIRKAIENELE
jgi:hypothetical protein